METKHCPKCQQTKPIDAYHIERRKGKADRPASYCRECWNAYCRERNNRPGNVAKAKAAYHAKCLRLGKGSLSKPWSEKTPEQKAKAYQAVKAWRARNADHAKSELRQGNQIRRSRAYAKAWPAICEHYGNVCLCCGFARPLCLDHVQPLAKGGPNLLTNAQPLCRSCNTGKGQSLNTARDYRPDGGQWIATFAALNPWLVEVLPPGRWHLTSEGRERVARLAQEAGKPLVMP